MIRKKILNSPIISLTITKLKSDRVKLSESDVYIGKFNNDLNDDVAEYGKSEGEVLDLLLNTYKSYYNLDENKLNFVISLNIQNN